jgi:hypothetical protein
MSEAYIATPEVYDGLNLRARCQKRDPHFGHPYDLMVSMMVCADIQKVPGLIPVSATNF